MSHPKHKISIICSKDSPRLRYILEHVFTRFWDKEYTVSTVPIDHGSIHLFYGVQDLKVSSRDILIPSHPILFETGIGEQSIESIAVDEQLFPFVVSHSSKDWDLLFDPFALAFYFITRYEEYLQSTLDQHDRFISSSSWQGQNNCLDKAIVDHALQKLGKVIFQKTGIQLNYTNRFRIQPTFDIDMPYAYHLKGWKAYGGILKDLFSFKIENAKARIRYLLTGQDPFDQFENIAQLCKEDQRVIFFLLQKWNPPHDLNHIADHEEWKQLVNKIAQWADIGIHPSYETLEKPDLIAVELSQLRKLSNQDIRRSRQHFLRFSLPATYRALIGAGITEDHSMTYADHTGFRAGTAHSFYWYDIAREQETSLLVYPYAVMDVGMREYMKLSPSEAIQIIKALQNEAANTGGMFGFVWHNSSVSRAYGWGEWAKVLYACLDLKNQRNDPYL